MEAGLNKPNHVFNILSQAFPNLTLEKCSSGDGEIIIYSDVQYGSIKYCPGYTADYPPTIDWDTGDAYGLNGSEDIDTWKELIKMIYDKGNELAYHDEVWKFTPIA